MERTIAKSTVAANGNAMTATVTVEVKFENESSMTSDVVVRAVGEGLAMRAPALEATLQDMVTDLLSDMEDAAEWQRVE